jgi:hypothetical protein
MVAEIERAPAVAAAASPMRAWPLRWLPAGCVLALGIVLPCLYGVPPGQVAVFAAYVLAVIVLPGTLLWRVFGPSARHLAEEVAAGTMLGYALEVLAYIPARAIRVPALVLVIPASTLVTFAAVPSLRRYWRGPADRVPGWWAWSVAGLAAAVLGVSGVVFYTAHGLTWPGYAAPYVDMTYQLALAGEVAHHMPPAIPYVTGEPLHYHWFFYLDPAATSHITGIELETLLYRLTLLPVLAAFTVLIAVAGTRFTGRLWAGPVAAGATLLLVAPNPYGWSLAPVQDTLLLTGPLWISPTQTFGAALFAAFVLPLCELLLGGRQWLVAGVLLAAVMGAKATYLPLLLAGLLTAFVAVSLRTRRPYWRGLILAAATGGFLLFAQFGLYGGASQGLRLEPFGTLKVAALVTKTHLMAPVVATPLRPALLAAALTLACYLLMWAGITVLLGRRAMWSDPAMWLLLGIGAAGIGAALLLGHPGLSQLYFLQSARPYLAIAAVWGLALALSEHQVAPRRLVAAAATGMAAVWILRLASPNPPIGSAAGLFAPLLVLAAVLVLIVMFQGRDAVLPIGLAAVAGTCLAMTPARVAGALTAAPYQRFIPHGAPSAGRWLRDHSTPGQVVATDLHCRPVARAYCENRHFWISAFTERHVLVEGWGYTNRITSQARRFDPHRQHSALPFWDGRLLAANDAVFRHPTAQNVAVLRDRYHVRWLFTTHRPPGLLRYARLRHVSGKCVVYELR